MKNTVIIKKNSEFVHILKKGKWYSGDFLSMYILSNSNNKLCQNALRNGYCTINRLGIAVSKKFSKSSVKRNRVKRLIREVYRLNEDSIESGNSIIFLWKNKVDFNDVNYTNINNDIIKCLKKACILKKEEFNA